MKPSVVLNDATQYQAAIRLVSLARRFGIDVERAGSWGQLATLVSEQMGGKCYLCEAASTDLGFWIPADQVLGPEVSWVSYLHCGNHTIDEIELRIAEKIAEKHGGLS